LKKLYLGTMANSPDHNQSLVISYLTLRKAVGILGMALPVALLIGFFIFDAGCDFPPSISHFYYTDLGNLFVGTLCAVSLFLFSYNGHDKGDKVTAKIAGSFALLVAIFPTNFGEYTSTSCIRMSQLESNVSNAIHYISAALLFSSFAYFSLVQFTKTNKPGRPSVAKRTRNNIYKICGWVIVVCIVGIIGIYWLPVDLYRKIRFLKPTFTLETIALLAFGFSWLIKGNTFFKDKE